MNNQKDISEIGLHPYGQDSNPITNSLLQKPQYEFVNKKTEKLVTALYMVTDCMDSGDAIKNKLRLLGVDLLSDMYKLSILSPAEKHLHISTIVARVYEILSLVDIACTIGFISDMNTAILKREFEALVAQLKSNQTKDKHFTFTLHNKMFEVETPQSSIAEMNDIKDKKTVLSMSYKNNSNTSRMSLIKRHQINNNIIDKKDRSEKILSIIKDKSILMGNELGVSIKDISFAFTDCSEKTIQRELNSLVAKGQIKKMGAKRWSRYRTL